MTLLDLDQVPVTTGMNVVTLTPAGAEAVRNLLDKRELKTEDYALRVFIQGGGCSGFQYGMALEGQSRETDHSFDYDDIRVVVDEISMDYLRGATIDFVEDIMGGGFKIDNPNAVASCGCGNSFRTRDSGPSPAGGGCC